MRIIRVFPTRTSFTPDDAYVFAGKNAHPPLFRPAADQVHVSVTFTWDLDDAEQLAAEWSDYYEIVRLGGPAWESPVGDFTPGMYVKHGVTFTSRGCDNRCPWCLVPEREGRLRELDDFAPGWIIQDNNFLMCSSKHRQKVYKMLRAVGRAAKFSGGLDARLMTPEIAEELRGVKIAEVWFAADTWAGIVPLARATRMVEWLPRWRKRCYVLIGFDGERIEDAEGRLEEVWGVGCTPFAQLYQPADEWIHYDSDWKVLVRKWSRPAAMAAAHGGWG
jgi:hypothetical protein